MTDAAEFTVRFHWPEDLGADDPVHALEAATLPQAKMQAAMLYAGAAFKLTPPIGYVVFHQGSEVHRYPVTQRSSGTAAA